ncbi:kinase [Rossellomorea vietnamensis]|uniref:kinase n=1 Tax=Rossellomorea vietnamensis TaxID=218284 RepID=UPI003D26DC32
MNFYVDVLKSMAARHDKPRFILGIDGLSRSGKTTFVKQLSAELNEESLQYHIFHIDDFIVDRKRRYDTGLEEWQEYFQLQWDVTWLSKHFFQGLPDMERVTLPYYDGATDTHETRTIQLPKEGLIIIEGVFLQRKEWKHFFDKVVYLDCPRETRFNRESNETKKNISKFKNRYWKAEDYYINQYNPREQADIVITT